MRARLLALALLMSPCGAVAQTLFDDLGGMGRIERIVADTVDRSVADPRIAWSFDNVNHDRLKRLIAQQFCNLSGGPCARRERGMRPAHRHLQLTEADFNALVEHLQDSMDAAGTPFRTQLRLIALLAPMKREIVTR